MEGGSGPACSAGRGAKAEALRLAAQHLKAGDVKAFYKTLAVAAIGESDASVTLASTDEPDCPVVACSEAFLLISGYGREEVVGKNMRFLNRGCAVSSELRHSMRISARTGRSFSGVVQNRRKSGELFENLLYVTAVRVGSEVYMLGVLHDTKEHDVAQVSDSVPRLMQTVLDSIFAATVNAWAAVQASHLGAAKLGPARYVEDILQPFSDQARFAAARDTFVSRVDHLHCTDLRDAPDSRGSSTNDSGSRVGGLGASRGGLASQIDARARHLRLSRSKPAAPTAEDGQSDKAGEPPTNAGNAGHPDSCQPCASHCYSRAPCGRGSNCLYCHMEHPRRRRPRCQWRKGAKKAGAEKESAEGDEDSGAEAAEKAAPKVPLAPTPEGLMPLLVSLSHLSPLPFPMPPVSTRSTQPRLARVGETEADATRERDRLCIEYSESSIVISLGQRKETLPFVGGVHSGVLTFEVCPRLSGGLSLDAASGVIGGLATEATAGEGSTHTVVMKSSCGACAETYIFIRVVAEQTEAGDVLQTGSHSIEH